MIIHKARQATPLRHSCAGSDSGTRRFSYRESGLFNRLSPDLRDVERLGYFEHQLIELLLSASEAFDDGLLGCAHAFISV